MVEKYRIVDLGSPTFNMCISKLLKSRPCTEKDKNYLLEHNLVWYNDEPNSDWQKDNPDMLCCDSEDTGIKIYEYLTGENIDKNSFKDKCIKATDDVMNALIGERFMKMATEALNKWAGEKLNK